MNSSWSCISLTGFWCLSVSSQTMSYSQMNEMTIRIVSLCYFKPLLKPIPVISIYLIYSVTYLIPSQGKVILSINCIRCSILKCAPLSRQSTQLIMRLGPQTEWVSSSSSPSISIATNEWFQEANIWELNYCFAYTFILLQYFRARISFCDFRRKIDSFPRAKYFTNFEFDFVDSSTP